MISIQSCRMYLLCSTLIFVKAVYAEIPADQFQHMIQTLKTYDLDHADESGFHYYMSLITTINEQGSETQKSFTEHLFHEEPAQREYDHLVKNINNILESNVISPTSWHTLVNDINILEEYGTSLQQEAVHNSLSAHTKKIQNAIRSIISSTLQSVDVQHMLKTITIGTLYGILPSVALKTMALLSGNIDLATAGSVLIDVGVLSALDTLVRYSTQKTPDAISASLAGGASVALTDFFKRSTQEALEQSWLGPIKGPMVGMIQGASMVLLKQELERRGSIQGLLTNLNWQDMAFGPEEQAITQQNTVYEHIKNTLANLLNNTTAQRAVATTITYAAEGALTGAVMHSLGIGFYEESTLGVALTQSMIRGAVEGLYHFSSYKDESVGALARLHGGFVARTVQQWLATGATALNPLSITPVIVNQLCISAVNSIVRTSNGWRGLLNTLFKGKKT
jgi:hypothetical protein